MAASSTNLTALALAPSSLLPSDKAEAIKMALKDINRVFKKSPGVNGDNRMVKTVRFVL